MPDPDRKLGILRPHDARHTFAYGLSQASGHNRAELERRLGHANDRYLRLYTNPPDDIIAMVVARSAPAAATIAGAVALLPGLPGGAYDPP